MSKIIIAIDPGKKGGLAVMDLNNRVVDVANMPDTPQDLLEFLKEAKNYGDCVCYLEKVGGMPGNGGSAMFNFGKGYGHIEMALLALEIPTMTITPQMWQKTYNVGSVSITRSDAADKREHKNKLKAKAQQLFPSLGKRVTLQTCDALLIGLYGCNREK